MEKEVRDAMGLMSWDKNKSMYRVIYRDILGKTKGDAFWDSMNRRQERLRATLNRQD